MHGVSGNWEHVQRRGMMRIPMEYRAIAGRMLATLAQRAKSKSLPNGPWYRPVVIDRRTVAYICGQGSHLSTILSGDMRPKGRKI